MLFSLLLLGSYYVITVILGLINTVLVSARKKKC